MVVWMMPKHDKPWCMEFFVSTLARNLLHVSISTFFATSYINSIFIVFASLVFIFEDTQFQGKCQTEHRVLYCLECIDRRFVKTKNKQKAIVF